MPENSEGKQQQLTVDQVVLIRDRATGAVSIGGNVQDIDLMLNILAQATRHMDVQFRITAAVAAQEQLKQRQADFERVQRLMGKA
jgi:allophanate hydrolase subunit 2